MLSSCWNVFGSKKSKFIKDQEASGLKTRNFSLGSIV